MHSLCNSMDWNYFYTYSIVFALDLDKPTIQKTMANSNTTLIFECLTFGYPSPSYQWQHLNEVVSNSSTIQIDNFNNTSIGTYICQVDNIVGKLFTETRTSEHCKLQSFYYNCFYQNIQTKIVLSDIFISWKFLSWPEDIIMD